MSTKTTVKARSTELLKPYDVMRNRFHLYKTDVVLKAHFATQLSFHHKQWALPQRFVACIDMVSNPSGTLKDAPMVHKLITGRSNELNRQVLPCSRQDHRNMEQERSWVLVDNMSTKTTEILRRSGPVSFEGTTAKATSNLLLKAHYATPQY